MVETESARLVTNGCGLKVIYPAGIEKMFTGGEISLSAEPYTLYDILELSARCADLRVKVFETVAVITWPEYRYVYTALEGTCTDAETGKPITDFRIETDFLPPMLAVQTNGSFVCGIPQRFDYSWSPNARFADHDISEASQVIRISATGYRPQAITNALYGDKINRRFLKIRLKREEQPANQQSEGIRR
jgi:hypothetical protein